MGLLNRLFGSTESIAKEIEADDAVIKKQWDDYLKTIPKKKIIIGKLNPDAKLNSNLKELASLLALELTDIRSEEKEESELIADLESLEQSKKIKRVDKLEQTLCYMETRHEYIHKLLEQLDSILKSEMNLVIVLQKGSKDIEKLISSLKSQLSLELNILDKIEKRSTFHEMFSALVKGEHIIKFMDSREKRMLSKMQKGLGKIYGGEIDKGVTFEWAMGVFESVEDSVREAIANGLLEMHPDVDFEFVNTSQFLVLVKGKIQSLRKRPVSDQMITVFVHLFREWYNERE
ncbi:MAG: hypothetical protein WC471_04405 [Candidatus Woesearchaeota archaeon]